MNPCLPAVLPENPRRFYLIMQNQFPPLSAGVQEPFFLADYPDYPVYMYIPESYSPEKKTPLLFFMHGGDKNSPVDAPFKTYLDPEKGTLYPLIKEAPFVTVAPCAPFAKDGKRWNYPGSVEYIDAVINAVRERINVDDERIIFGGHSMGGFGAYHNGTLMADRFSCVLLSAGAWLETDFKAFLGTPVYILHGRYDCAANYKEFHVEPRHHDWCGVDFARAAHELMVRDGVTHVYDEHEGGHGLRWEPAQMAFLRFIDYAMQFKKDPYPVRCAVVSPAGSADPSLVSHRESRYLRIDETLPGSVELDKIVLRGPNIAWSVKEFCQQSYTLSTASHEGARIVAENKGGNCFEISCENVAGFTLFLSSCMADVDRELLLRVNGREYRAMPLASQEKKDYSHQVKISLEDLI